MEPATYISPKEIKRIIKRRKSKKYSEFPINDIATEKVHVIKEAPVKPIKYFQIIDFQKRIILEKATRKEAMEFLGMSNTSEFGRYLDKDMRCKTFYYIKKWNQ